MAEPAVEPAAAAAGTQVHVVDDAVEAAADHSGLHIISWNVAGWKTTSEQIRRFKGGIGEFMNRHHADILCLQEVKLGSKVIANDCMKLGAQEPGYESFWACNEGNGVQRQGLNGVATFVRTGLVLRADSQSLGSQELDSEGRCLMTDHGAFVVFNVYVPNGAGGPRIPYKMRFLAALRDAMARQRAAGKAVILAGDLNMKARPADSHWLHRPVEIPRMRDHLARLAEAGKDCQPPNSEGLLPEAREPLQALVAAWPAIASALRAKEVKSFQTANSVSKQTFQRWGVHAKSINGDMVRLGSPCEREADAVSSFVVDGASVERDGEVVQGTDGKFLLVRAGVLCAGDVAECAKKLAAIDLPHKVVKSMSDTFGSLAGPQAVKDWMKNVMAEDGMLDSFVETHPSAQERFTCWDQYRSKRYENEGSRIDYILVDAPFFRAHALPGCPLQGHGRGASLESREAAMAAAVLGGLSQPTSFGGGGMPTLEEDEYSAQFRPSAGTGILYTPPRLSDHVAVSLLLAPGCRPDVTCAKDAVTLKCQPHRTVNRITDFFKRPSPQQQAGPPTKKPVAK